MSDKKNRIHNPNTQVEWPLAGGAKTTFDISGL